MKTGRRRTVAIAAAATVISIAVAACSQKHVTIEASTHDQWVNDIQPLALDGAQAITDEQLRDAKLRAIRTFDANIARLAPASDDGGE